MTVPLTIFEETQAAIAAGLLLSARRCEVGVCDGSGAALCHCNSPDVTVPVELSFQAPTPPRHATQPDDECDGADRPGWIEPPGPVHNHDTVSPDTCPPVKTSAVAADAHGGVARTAGE